VPKNNQTD